MEKERRTEVRERITLPVLLAGGGAGWTRDLSSSGIFLEAHGHWEVGDRIELSVELELETRKIRLDCEGEVVRVEAGAEGQGIGLRMLQSGLLELR